MNQCKGALATFEHLSPLHNRTQYGELRKPRWATGLTLRVRHAQCSAIFDKLAARLLHERSRDDGCFTMQPLNRASLLGHSLLRYAPKISPFRLLSPGQLPTPSSDILKTVQYPRLFPGNYYVSLKRYNPALPQWVLNGVGLSTALHMMTGPMSHGIGGRTLLSKNPFVSSLSLESQRWLDP